MGVNYLGAPPNLNAVQLASEFGLEFRAFALKTVRATNSGLIGGQVNVGFGQIATINTSKKTNSVRWSSWTTTVKPTLSSICPVCAP